MSADAGNPGIPLVQASAGIRRFPCRKAGGEWVANNATLSRTPVVSGRRPEQGTREVRLCFENRSAGGPETTGPVRRIKGGGGDVAPRFVPQQEVPGMNVRVPTTARGAQ